MKHVRDLCFEGKEVKGLYIFLMLTERGEKEKKGKSQITKTEESSKSSFVGEVGLIQSASIDVDKLVKIYEDYVTKLNALNEQSKKLAAPADNPDDGLQEFTDQVSILIEQLCAYRDVLRQVNAKDLDLDLMKHLVNTEEFTDVAFYSAAIGNKLTDLSTTWDMTRISHLDGVADLLESIDGILKLLHGMILGREEFSKKMDTFKQSLLRKLEEMATGSTSNPEPSSDEIKFILSDLSGFQEPVLQMGNGMKILYSGLQKLKQKIEETSKS